MAKEEDDIIAEIHDNVRRDRKRLEDFCDQITKIADETLGGDPLAKVGLADTLARLSDGLTRSNAQLVELAKLKVKREPKDNKGDRDDTLFDQIGPGFESDEEN